MCGVLCVGTSTLNTTHYTPQTTHWYLLPAFTLRVGMDTCAFCLAGVTIGLVISPTYGIILHGAHAIRVDLLNAFGFCLACFNGDE